jgi:hypothetical protein
MRHGKVTEVTDLVTSDRITKTRESMSLLLSWVTPSFLGPIYARNGYSHLSSLYHAYPSNQTII